MALALAWRFGGPLGLQKDTGTCDGYGHMEDESDYSAQPFYVNAADSSEPTSGLRSALQHPPSHPPNAQSFGSHTRPESLNLAQHHLQPPQPLPQHPLLTAGQAKAKGATRGKTHTTYSCELLSDPADQQEQCRRIRVIAYLTWKRASRFDTRSSDVLLGPHETRYSSMKPRKNAYNSKTPAPILAERKTLVNLSSKNPMG